MPFSSNSAADVPRAICGATNSIRDAAKAKSWSIPSADVRSNDFTFMRDTLSGRCYRHITSMSCLRPNIASPLTTQLESNEHRHPDPAQEFWQRAEEALAPQRAHLKFCGG